MKLNPDCIRDILMAVEEISTGVIFFEYNKDDTPHPVLAKYDHAELLYHMRQCKLSELIIGYRVFDSGGSVLISDLSPKGHEFLANIRKDTIWRSTKDIAAKVGSSSLSALMEIATSVVTDLIARHFSA